MPRTLEGGGGPLAAAIAQHSPHRAAAPSRKAGLFLLTAFFLAACQPLPHPFAADVPPIGSPLMTIPDGVSLSVAPVRGTPQATAQKLAAAVARALRQRQVPASAQTISVESDELSGVIEAAPSRPGSPVSVVALWRLANAKGRILGVRSTQAEAPAKDWQAGEKAAVTRLAAASADVIARLLLGKAATASLPPHPASKIVSSGGVPAQNAASRPSSPQNLRIFVAAVKGAPGNGGDALLQAMRFFLGRQKTVTLSPKREKGDYVLEGRVAVGKEEAGVEPIRILWRLLRPDGKAIGTVAQQHAVPTDLIEGSWGNLAYIIADAAQNGILDLLAHGAEAPQRS